MRYTPFKRQEIDRAIHDANLGNLSHADTIRFVKQQTDITIGHTQLVERRRILRLKAKEVWNKYRNDDYAYRLEHLERMNEARRVKESAAKKMMEYESNPRTFWQWKNSAYTLMEASKYLSELCAMIPEIDGIGVPQTYEMDQEIPSIPATSEDPQRLF